MVYKILHIPTASLVYNFDNNIVDYKLALFNTIGEGHKYLSKFKGYTIEHHHGYYIVVLNQLKFSHYLSKPIHELEFEAVKHV